MTKISCISFELFFNSRKKACAHNLYVMGASKTLLIAFFMLSSTIGFAKISKHQDILDKLNDTYKSLHSISCSLNLQIEYFDKSFKAETHSGYMKKSGDLYVSEILGLTNLVNNKYKLTIDHRRKQIRIHSAQKNKSKKEDTLTEFDPEQYNSIHFDISIVKDNNLEKVLLFKYKDKESPIQSLQLTIAMPDYKMTKIVYAYNKQYSDVSKTIIEYKNVMFNPKLSSQVFSEKPYITVSGGRLKPSSAYSDYKIVLN